MIATKLKHGICALIAGSMLISGVAMAGPAHRANRAAHRANNAARRANHAARRANHAARRANHARWRARHAGWGRGRVVYRVNDNTAGAIFAGAVVGTIVGAAVASSSN